MSTKFNAGYEAAPFVLSVRRFVGADGIPTCAYLERSPTDAPVAERAYCQFYLTDLYSRAPMCGAATVSSEFFSGERMLSSRPGTPYLTPVASCPLWGSDPLMQNRRGA